MLEPAAESRRGRAATRHFVATRKLCQREERRFSAVGRFCKFTADGIEYIDYKDVNLLRQFVPERAKILPRRISGNSARHQRMLAKALNERVFWR